MNKISTMQCFEMRYAMRRQHTCATVLLLSSLQHVCNRCISCREYISHYRNCTRHTTIKKYQPRNHEEDCNNSNCEYKLIPERQFKPHCCEEDERNNNHVLTSFATHCQTTNHLHREYNETKERRSNITNKKVCVDLSEFGVAIAELSDQLFDAEIDDNDNDNDNDENKLDKQREQTGIQKPEMKFTNKLNQAVISEQNTKECCDIKQDAENSQSEECGYVCTMETMEMLLNPHLYTANDKGVISMSVNDAVDNDSSINNNCNKKLQVNMPATTSFWNTTDIEQNVLSLLSTELSQKWGQSSETSAIINQITPELFNGLDMAFILPSRSLQAISITHKSMQRCNFTGVYWSNVKCSKCTFTRSIFFGSTISECHFHKCNFDGCIMKRVRIHGKVVFSECSFRFAAIGMECNSSNAKIEFVNCDFDFADFTNSQGLSNPRCFTKCHNTRYSTAHFPLKAGHSNTNMHNYR